MSWAKRARLFLFHNCVSAFPFPQPLTTAKLPVSIKRNMIQSNQTSAACLTSVLWTPFHGPHHIEVISFIFYIILLFEVGFHVAQARTELLM